MPFSSIAGVFRIPFCMAALLILALSAGCGKDKSGEASQAGGPPVSEVIVKTIAVADVPLNLEYVGQVAGSREVQVRARVGGILLKRSYEEGARVKQGDLLFEIDPLPYKAALEQARGVLGQAEARLANAKRNFDRMRTLRRENVVSQKDSDDARTEFEAASASAKAAQAAVREANLNLGYTRVEAPISGITSKETRSEGSLIGTGQDASLLTTINRIDPIYVNFSIPGPEAMKIRKDRAEGRMIFTAGSDFQVRFLAGDGSLLPQSGHINFLDTQVDAQTGVMKARAEAPNPTADILPGQFVRVRLEGAVLKQIMLIPQAAVLRTQQGPMVWVVNEKNIVSPRPVTLGSTLGNNYLLEAGITPGERIIVEGVIKVRPEMPVKPKEAAENGAPGSQPGQAAPQTGKQG